MAHIRTKEVVMPIHPPLSTIEVFVKGVKSTLISGATDHGQLTVIFSGASTLQTSNFNLTSSFQTFIASYTGSSVTKIVMYCSATINHIPQSVRFQFDDGHNGEIDVYDKQVLPLDTPYWTGWVQPDNSSYSFIAPAYFIDINASDGLGDLQNVTFNITTGATTGITSFLTTIKEALKPIGIPLPIRVQLNCYDVAGGSSANLIEKYYVNNPARFVTIKNGKTDVYTCYDVLSLIADTFYCQISQANGYWDISSKREINSPAKIFDWTTLTSTGSSMFNRAVDISSRGFFIGSDNQSRIRPLAEYDYIFYNNSLPTNILSNPVFTNNNFYSFSTATDFVRTVDPVPLGNPNTAHNFSTNTFALTSTPTGASTSIFFDCQMRITYSATTVDYYPPSIQIDLYSGSTWINGLQIAGFNGMKHYSADLTYTHSSTHYYLRVSVVPSSAVYSVVDCTFTNWGVSKDSFSGSTGYDTYFQGFTTGTTAIQISTGNTLYFGDTIESNDLATILYNKTTPTSSWTNYGSTGGSDYHTSLQQLYVYNKLQARQKYIKYLTFDMKGKNIEFNSVVTLNGVNYNVISLENDLQNNLITLEVKEIPSNKIGVTLLNTVLTTKNNQ